MGAKKSTINSPGAIYHANHGRGRHYSSCKKKCKEISKVLFSNGLAKRLEAGGAKNRLPSRVIPFPPAIEPFKQEFITKTEEA